MQTSNLPHIGDLEFSPEDFPALYRRLTILEFPLPVADILELRSALNIAIDGHHEQRADSARPIRLAEIYRDDLSRLGVTQPKHVERLTCLLGLLDELHTIHRQAARTSERVLHQALRDNAQARQYSLRLGLIMGAGLLLVLALIGHGDIAWGTKTLAAITGYLSLDAFYAIGLLLRQRQSLRARLRQQTGTSIETIRWPTLIRNLALILGYARGDRAETAFLLDDSQDLRSA